MDCGGEVSHGQSRVTNMYALPEQPRHEIHVNYIQISDIAGIFERAKFSTREHVFSTLLLRIAGSDTRNYLYG